jgi:hypothetical protein
MDYVLPILAMHQRAHWTLAGKDGYDEALNDIDVLVLQAPQIYLLHGSMTDEATLPITKECCVAIWGEIMPLGFLATSGPMIAFEQLSESREELLVREQWGLMAMF